MPSPALAWSRWPVRSSIAATRLRLIGVRCPLLCRRYQNQAELMAFIFMIIIKVP